MKAKIEFIGGMMDGTEMFFDRSSTLGRDKSCDIPISGDRYVSKKHALLRKDTNGYFLEDLGSTNGTFIDDEPVHGPSLLPDGQIFKVGRTLLKITYG